MAKQQVVKALSDHMIVVDTSEDEGRTKSGIILTSPIKVSGQGCKVIMIGPDQETIKVGDTIYFSQYAGIKIDVEDKKYLMVKPDELSLYITSEEIIEEEA